MDDASPPMRGRGLKQSGERQRRKIDRVAPHAGAWIETTPFAWFRMPGDVAPHAGAWIETPRGR